MAELTNEAKSPDCIFGKQSSPHFCKSEPTNDSANTSPLCPQCNSKKVWRDGIRYISGGEVQRWLCRVCGLRFSISSNQKRAVETIETLQTKELKSKGAKDITRQICAKGAKNLHVSNNNYVGTGEVTAEIRAAVKVFEGWMEKEGYKKNRYGSNILTLVRLGADLKNPEDVKAKIGAHKVRDGMKMLLCYSYEAYLKMNKLTWDRPKYKQDEIIPFIPEEGELDQLISAAQSKRTAAYLQTLKETYTDPGEALPIEWKDVSGKLITIRHPVKNHRPRTLEVSDKLIAMINMLPRKSNRIFDTSYCYVK